MRCTYSDGETWKKVKILKVMPGYVLLEQLYPTLLVLKPVKVCDLIKGFYEPLMNNKKILTENQVLQMEIDKQVKQEL